MSRIDEALKRVSQGDHVRRAMGVVEPAVHPAAERPLDDYPVEAPGQPGRPQVELPREHRVPSSPRSAPRSGASTAPAPWTGGYPAAAPQWTANPRLVVSGQCDRASLEQFRRLAASLHEAQIERGLKALVVTSAVPKEGKTLTAVNLALTFSEAYKRRVLLIDADLHRPSVHEVLGIANDSGLSEALGSSPVDLSPAQVSPLLAILTSGRPDQNPLAGLSSERMGALLAEATSLYDWVIIDTPPLAVLADAQLLARLTQAALLVVRAGSTPFAIVNKAIEELGRENVVGTVLNGVEEEAIPAVDYYGHYYGADGDAR